MRLISGLSMAALQALGFGTILVLLLGMASLSLVRMQAMACTLQEITVQNAARSQTLDVMGRTVALYVQTLGDLGSTDMEGGVAVLTRARVALRDYEAAQARIVGMLPASADVQALMERVKVSARAAQQLLALGDKQAEGRGPTAQAFQVRNEYSKDTAHWSARQQAWGKAVNDLSDWHDAANAVLSATATAVEATRRMARHDLSHPINTHRKDEIGGLLSALETMRLNLHQLAAGVRVTSDDINNASNEIAQGSLNLSARTEDAANTLQTTLSAIALINASVGETTAAARSAQLLSGEASDVATRKISDITSLIDGIAFQTNILALNAAVEAARAG